MTIHDIVFLFLPMTDITDVVLTIYILSVDILFKFKSPLTLKNFDHHKLQEKMIMNLLFPPIVVQLLGYPKDKDHTLGNLSTHIYNDFVYFYFIICI